MPQRLPNRLPERLPADRDDEAACTPGGPCLVDQRQLDRATFHDPALRAEVIGMFLAQAPALMRAIDAAVELRLRADHAHQLIGSARALGCDAIVAAAERVEAAPADPAARVALAGTIARTLPLLEPLSHP